MRAIRVCLFVVVGLSLAASAQAAHKWNLKDGKPDLQSAGQLAFGPDGILFVGDTKGGAVFAIETGDAKVVAEKPAVQVDKLNERLLAVVGGDKAEVRDLAVNPLSGAVFLSVAKGAASEPALVRVDAQGVLTLVPLENVPFLKATLPNPPEDKVVGEGPRARNRRGEAITDMAFVDGRLLVAGMTNGAAPSAVLQYAFPFADTPAGTNVEIYHAAHGKSEDYAAIRTFVPMTINGEATLLAGFTCTPLVRFEVEGLRPGSRTKGTTVAELGNRNTPLDMVTYEQAGERYLLVANNNRGVMKVGTKEIGRENGLTTPVPGGGTAGQSFETIAALEGTTQLDKLTEAQAVVIVQKDGVATLKTVPLP
jgi:hypothetical protein